ncbi:MAG TPA: hypothetical protein VK747_20895 [Blastocatellia bacterium]|nr:hypothetical protein [Blastocatellia bacterium]
MISVRGFSQNISCPAPGSFRDEQVQLYEIHQITTGCVPDKAKAAAD